MESIVINGDSLEAIEQRLNDAFAQVEAPPVGVRKSGHRLLIEVPASGGWEVMVSRHAWTCHSGSGDRIRVITRGFERRELLTSRRWILTLASKSPRQMADDDGTFVEAVPPPACAEAENEDSPFSSARLRGVGARKALIRTAGGARSGREVAELLGIPVAEVEARRQAGRLLAVRVPGDIWKFPNLQFSQDRLVPGLSDVLDALGDLDGWTKLAFLVNGNYRLGGKAPVERLKAGDATAVVAAADAFGVHGAA